MCEFEENILKLLKEEQSRLKNVFTDKDAPYMKSLAVGILNAESKLAKCKQKTCIENVYKENRDRMPMSDLRGWSNQQVEVARCKGLI